MILSKTLAEHYCRDGCAPQKSASAPLLSAALLLEPLWLGRRSRLALPWAGLCPSPGRPAHSTSQGQAQQTQLRTFARRSLAARRPDQSRLTGRPGPFTEKSAREFSLLKGVFGPY